MRFLSALVASFAFASARNYTGPAHCTGECQIGPDDSKMSKVMKLKEMNIQYQFAIGQATYDGPSIRGKVPCANGFSGEYACDNLDMLSFVNYHDLGSSTGRGNDIWGWTSQGGIEYVIMCATDGTSFVDISDPEQPIVVAWLQGVGPPSTWRDAKVFQNTVYIISETASHGMQYYDMSGLDALDRTQLHNVNAGTYDEFGSCHNIVINEDTGFAYGVGSRTCRGGLHVVDLNGDSPEYSGCFDNDGYTHDAQCVIYQGPDSIYRGSEICFAYNEDSLTIVDVSDKNNMRLLSRMEYAGSAYSHQGWLSKDSRFLILDDELDESQNSNGLDGYTCSYVWDVQDLTAPVLKGRHVSGEQAIDHNMYIRDDQCYQANYEAGLRILDISNIAQFSEGDSFPEVAFFDVRPQSTNVAFNGAWSVYNYFASNTIAVSSIERGLFILQQTNMPKPL